MYSIELGEWSIKGVARHLTIQLNNSEGNEIREINGLATGRDGTPKIIGFGPLGDTIQIYTDSRGFFDESRSPNTLAIRPDSQLQQDLAMIEIAKIAINGKNLVYHMLGADLFDNIGANSNAAAVTMLKMLGLVLSRICAAPSARLGHLAFEGQGAFASQC